MNVTIHRNIITFSNVSASQIATMVYERRLTQLNLVKTGESKLGDVVFDLSYAMREQEHREFAGLIHRYNAEQRAKNPHLEPKGDGPKGPTPPTGGTPGAAKAVEFTKTNAIAA
jgi:hypothetical protein